MSHFLKLARSAAVLAAAAGSVIASAVPALAWDFNNPKDKDILCQYYANGAMSDAKKNREMECGGTGNRWGENYQGHYKWCMGQRGQSLIKSETLARQSVVSFCHRCDDYANARNKFEAEWDSQRCGRIPDLRQMDRYRNTGVTKHGLLMFTCMSTTTRMSIDEMAAAGKADDRAMAKCESYGANSQKNQSIPSSVPQTGRFKPIKKLKITPTSP